VASANVDRAYGDARDRGVTGRVAALSIALAVVFGYIIPIIDVRLSNTFLGAAHLPPGAIAVLLILLLVINPLLIYASRARGGSPAMLAVAALSTLLAGVAFTSWGIGSLWAWALATAAVIAFIGFALGRHPLSRNEILTVYTTCLFSCLVPGHGGENFFITNIIGPYYYASPENKWLSFLSGHVPSWFSPALAGGYVPGSPGYNGVQDWFTSNHGAVPWQIWIIPLVTWSLLVLASYVMLGCLSVILRAQWAEREALSFPLLRLPVELTEESSEPRSVSGVLGPFFRNRLMWIGFGIAVFIQLANGLNVYFPDVPQIPLELTGQYFTESPWNQIGWTPFRVLPIVVGITYLLTSEVSFSLWFFYWFMKFELIFAYFLGFMPASLPTAIGATGGAKTFTSYQQVGCYVGYVVLLLWTGREHLAHVARRAFGRARARDSERNEVLSYPVAFWGFVLSFAFIIGWSMMAGMSLGLAIALWLSYLVIAIALTRVVVEGGLLFVQQGWMPMGTLAQIAGSGPGTWLPATNVVPASFVQGSMMTDLRAFLMPSFLQSFKLAYDRGIKPKTLLALIAAVVLITFGMSLWMNIRLGYEYGGLQLNSWFAVGGAKKPATDANQLINGVPNASWFNIAWMGAGALMTLGMMIARSRLIWFPLHPLGLLMSLTYPMNVLWFSLFVGWLCKTLITRFGGSDTYRRTVPLFLGLALGDVVMMLLWLVIDGWQGRIMHQLMPG
jgi:hypothetical protein